MTVAPRKFLLALLAGLLPLLTAAAPTTAPTNKRVLIISIDGCRPDLLLRGDTPTLHQLLDEGAYTFWAQTTAVSVTIPSHVSMLTGARPQVHQIEWNHDLPLAHPVYPAVPTLFEVAHNAGYTTGIVAGKSKFDVFLKPGTMDVSWVPSTEVVSNREVLSHVLSVINAGPPQVLMVHLPETDKVGHAVGWATPQYMAALHKADSAIGTILGTLASKQLLENTMIIVTADHGGAGKTHGPDDPRCRNIPWICVGPGVRRGIDLTSIATDRTIRTEDTFATACQFLGIPVDPKLDGRPVLEVMDRSGQELLSDAVPVATPTAAPTAGSTSVAKASAQAKSTAGSAPVAVAVPVKVAKVETPAPASTQPTTAPADANEPASPMATVNGHSTDGQ
ncbi:MAG: type phosphodiesterase/nucleotide pyrophosphatase [Phycisphaerales bacterium]|nr:type phosphodiesterase/nucleotide pyrophosphatase [Phycisphaerales bacterium]